MPNFDINNYIPVQERINKFWQDFPDGAIVTSLMSDPTDFTTCRYSAQVFKHRDDQRASAYGWAFEVAGGRMANSTSHEENCETSAIGRALANMGYATSHATRPSREEMRKASGPDYESGEVAAPPQRAPHPEPPIGTDVRPHEPARPAMYQPQPDEPATTQQIKRMWAKQKGLQEWSDWSDDQFRDLVKQMTGKDSSKELTAGEADQVIATLARFEQDKPQLAGVN